MPSPKNTICFVEHKDVFGGGQVFLTRLIEQLKATFGCVLVSSHNARLARECERRGIDHLQLDLGRIRKTRNLVLIAMNIARRVFPTLRLAGIIRSRKVNVLCANDVYSFLACWAAGVVTRREIVLVAHNTTYPRNLFTRFVIRRAKRIIAVSDHVRRHLVFHEPLAASKITVIHNGVQLRRKPPTGEEAKKIRRRIGCAAGDRVVAYIGRLSREKGVEYLMKAIPSVLKRQPRCRFVFAGEGPEEDRLKIMSQESGIKDRIVFTGFVDDIEQIIPATEIVVIPSLVEGLPYVLLETMMWGKAVVATEVGGIPEVIKHGENGILVPPMDSEALAESIVRLLKTRRNMTSLGKAAHQHVAENFSLQTMVEKYRNVFFSFLGEPA